MAPTPPSGLGIAYAPCAMGATGGPGALHSCETRSCAGGASPAFHYSTADPPLPRRPK